jgi:hypothetical protein
MISHQHHVKRRRDAAWVSVVDGGIVSSTTKIINPDFPEDEKAQGWYLVQPAAPKEANRRFRSVKNKCLNCFLVSNIQGSKVNFQVLTRLQAYPGVGLKIMIMFAMIG